MPAPEVEAEPGLSRLALFAYASLVSPASAGETLGRPVGPSIRATLEGFSRTWTLGRDNLTSEKTFARADGSLPRFCLGLNLEPAEGVLAPNGALVEVAPAEFDRLDLRERRYRRLEVTDAIVCELCDADSFDAVFAYSARAEHHHPGPPADAIVIGNYLRTIEAAFDNLGPGQLDRFRATTKSPPVDIEDAILVRDRIPEGSPRGW